MVLYGYTIGEDSNPNTSGNQLPVYRFLIPSAPTGSIAATLVGTVDITSTAATRIDLEGLATNPTTGRVSAVNEARVTGTTTAIDPAVIVVNNVDVPFAPATVSPTRTPSDLRRFGFESGADFDGNTLYNISGNPVTANGTVGSSLYRITTANSGTISLVAAAPTAAQTQGTQPTNPGKYADGLAIDNLNPGPTRAFASDFDNRDEIASDNTKNNLYKVDLLTGELSEPIVLRTPSGENLNVTTTSGIGLDSGLAFTNSGSQRLLALLENGAVYEITGYQDELAASGLGLGSATGTNGAGFATATLIGNVNLPNAVSGAIDYEGFTIVNE
ncbi:water stress protein WSP1 [Nostoc sphaeroides CHAB 2801]|uniref:water stress protein WSP1 n=1 Tax=Nostoc sphaeroides TaxID=446679 RepID=UPI000E4F3237|nr:water stress protein WSP1 [Nostoc sphaeroides]MCC5627170.1 water stress protein WSP1 [Nostoc sphaeroides CHAB 2801]